MSLWQYKDLRGLVTRLRDDLNNPTKETRAVLIFAYNRTGKTRLSMEFKNVGKGTAPTRLLDASGDAIATADGDDIEVMAEQGDTLYFNAFTEDLFTWENDFEGGAVRYLRINPDSKFLNGLKELSLDGTIADYLRRYADFDFDIDYVAWKVTFRKGEAENMKISRGEQNLFIWSLFMALCDRLIDGHESYRSDKYLYIDDPISSLDDDNAVIVACDLARLIRRAAGRKGAAGAPDPVKVVFSSHHALFFNVMCNELGRHREGEAKVPHRRYFLRRPGADGSYELRATEDTPFFHHVATLAELKAAADPDTGKLYVFHFNALRSVMEKTASFFGHTGIEFCLKSIDNEKDRALYDRALNIFSHGKYAIHEPTEMGEDNKNLFRRILRDFTAQFPFNFPAAPPSSGTAPALSPVT